MSSDLNTDPLKVALWQNACLNFCMLFCKILKDKPQGFNNKLGLLQDQLQYIDMGWFLRMSLA